MLDISRLITEVTGIDGATQGRLFETVFIGLLIWIINLVSRALLTKRIKDVTRLYQIRKIIDYTVITIGIILIARIWFSGIQSLATFLGLLSAGIAVALRDPLVNLAGWGFIIWRKPFGVGDRVQLAELKGDVIDIRLFAFMLLEIGNWVDADQSTGRIIHIPNGRIFTEVLANYNRGFHYIWNELPIMITFESDWKKARAILEDIAQRHSLHLSKEAEKNLKKVAQKMMIFYTTLSPTVYISIENSGVTLTIRYLCQPRQRRDKSQAIFSDILEAFLPRKALLISPILRSVFILTPLKGKKTLALS